MQELLLLYVKSTRSRAKVWRTVKIAEKIQTVSYIHFNVTHRINLTKCT